MNIRVLLIGTNFQQQIVLKRLFAQEGCQIASFADPKIACQAVLATLLPHIILLDASCHYYRFHSLTYIRFLRKHPHFHSIPLLATVSETSHWHQWWLARKAHWAGATANLLLPCTNKDIRKLLQRYCISVSRPEKSVVHLPLFV